MTDPIADMIIRIKNAFLAKKSQVVMPHSKIKESIAGILLENDYISKVEITKKLPQDDIVLTLRYVGKTSAISDVKRLSKPGLRRYSKSREIPKTLGGYGLTIVSTSKGIMSGKQARSKNIGGELLCQIW